MDMYTHLMQLAKTAPLIGREEEPDLIVNAQRGNRRAADRLIRAHMRLSVSLAYRYRGYGLPVEDLIQAGNLGLANALQRYQPGHDTRFATYATWWVRSEIQEFVLRNVSTVRIGSTLRQKTLFFKLRTTRSELERTHPCAGLAEITDLLAARFGAEVDEVERIFAALGGGDWSLDAPVLGEDGELAFGDLIADMRPGPDEVVAEHRDGGKRRRQLQDAIGRLPARDQRIVHARTLAEEPVTLEVLGTELGISKERIRQLEVRAVKSLSADVLGQAADLRLGEVAACL